MSVVISVNVPNILLVVGAPESACGAMGQCGPPSIASCPCGSESLSKWAKKLKFDNLVLCCVVAEGWGPYMCICSSMGDKGGSGASQPTCSFT